MAHTANQQTAMALDALVLAEREVVGECGPFSLAPARPTVSGNSNVDSADRLELPALADPCSTSGNDVAADVRGGEQLPRLVVVAAAESDNEADDCFSDEPTPKFRRLSCSEPPPAVRAALRPELLAVMEARGVTFLPPSAVPVEDYCRSTIAAEQPEDNFYVYNLAVVEKLYAAWGRMMPRVHPCYAVKCNPDEGLLATLAALGAGFDCASEAELAAVMALGVGPERLVYAHPCKPPKQIRWAASNGVDLTTFDTESELIKMAQHHPSSGLLLRIRADDPAARCQLGNKYGAELSTVPRLLEAAAALGLCVRGVSFHVGSGAKNPEAFTSAIESARTVFDMAAALGFQMDTLDLGGGFCGGAFDAAGQVDLGGVPDAINAALDRLFPDDGVLRIVAEPGRYFAEAFATYACYINGWRERQVAAPDAAAAEAAAAGNGTVAAEEQQQGGGTAALRHGGTAYDYFITDGLYGSMNCLMYDHAELAPAGLRSPLLPPVTAAEEAQLFPSTLFGPTCDGLDTVCRDVPMPRLRTGDWVLFPSFGAYTIAGAVNFNGFDITGARVHYVYC